MQITIKQITKGFILEGSLFPFIMISEHASIVAAVYQQNTNVTARMATNLKPMVVTVAWAMIFINYWWERNLQEKKVRINQLQLKSQLQVIPIRIGAILQEPIEDRIKTRIHTEIQIRTISKIEVIEDEVNKIRDGDRINVPVNTRIRVMVGGGITQDLPINENITGKYNC